MSKEDKYIVVIDPLSRPDDKFAVAGTRENVAKYFVSNMEHSFNARSLKTIPAGHSLYWVDFEKKNWAGCGSGASRLFTSIGDAKSWILTRIEEMQLDTGIIQFEVVPVSLVVKDEDELWRDFPDMAVHFLENRDGQGDDDGE